MNEIHRDGRIVVYAFVRSRLSPNALLQSRAAGQSTVVDFTLKEPDIEEIVRTLFKGG